MLPLDKVRDLISKHNSLEKDLSSGSIDKKKYAEKSKEYSDLNEIINEANEYLLFDKENYKPLLLLVLHYHRMNVLNILMHF